MLIQLEINEKSRYFLQYLSSLIEGIVEKNVDYQEHDLFWKEMGLI